MKFRLWSDEIEAVREVSRSTVWPLIEEFSKLNDRSQDIDEQRRRAQKYAKSSPDGTDAYFSGVRCRIFRPDSDPQGTYIHFHGGGFALGSPEMNDSSNLEMSRKFSINVVSVDYRLAPEHPHPAGLDDCYAATSWLMEHADSELGSDDFILGGESAGAYYSAAVALRVRDQLGAIDKVAGLNLVYGAYDFGGTPSALGYRLKHGPNIAADDSLPRFLTLYAPGLDEKARRDSDISPMFAELRGLPPALFSVGTLDHVFDDSILMAARWAASGNETELFVAPDMPHGFNMFPSPITNEWKTTTERWFTERIKSR